MKGINSPSIQFLADHT